MKWMCFVSPVAEGQESCSSGLTKEALDVANIVSALANRYQNPFYLP